MSANITVDNFPSINLVEKTELSADAAAGATALKVRNNQGLAISDLLLAGLPGADTSEILSIATVNANGNDLTTGATKFKHLTNEQVTKLFGDQARIYRAPNVNGTTPADAAFTTLATISLEPDQINTSYNDAAGSSDYWYKYTFRNSVSSAETALAACQAVRGGGFGDYCSLDDIRGEAGFKNAPYVTDSMIDEKRQAAQAEINSALGGYYDVPFDQPVNPYIVDITIRLAAGLLMLKEYGAYDNSTKAMAEDKVKSARADYADLQAGSKTLKDQNGASMATGNSSGTSGLGFSALPNEATVTTGQQYDPGTGQAIAGSGDFMFRVDDKY